MFQKTVYNKQAIGMEGEFYDDSPRRVSPYIVASETGAAIGRVFTADTSAGATDKSVVVGGTGAFRGIAVNPKNYPVVGGLVASLALAKGTAAQLCRMGIVFVRVAGAVEPDYLATYNTTTGEISGIASGEAPEGSALIPNAVFKFFPAAAGEVAVLQLTD